MTQPIVEKLRGLMIFLAPFRYYVAEWVVYNASILLNAYASRRQRLNARENLVRFFRLFPNAEYESDLALCLSALII